MCTDVRQGDDPPPDTVQNADDCDDTNRRTHPGAGEKEADGELLCQKDNDLDGYGDDDPPPGVDLGSDCDDESAETRPGIGPNPLACYADYDHDGQGDANPPTGVSPGDDCDDNDPNTFKGAAPNDDASACMTDVDHDDWGDNSPGNTDVTPGTDCDDSHANTYVGAAETENPSACMRDDDDDGWGDTNVPGGVDVGSDCYDEHAHLNPDTMTLISINGISGGVQTVNLETGAVETFTGISAMGSWSIPTEAIDPISGMLFVTNTIDNSLHVVDYCNADPPTPLQSHGYDLCGIAFTAAGRLYGFDSEVDLLVELDPDTGDPLSTQSVTLEGFGLNVGDCGMAYDCVDGTVLLADVSTKKVYRLDVDTAVATVVADVPAPAFGRSLAFDPVTKNVHSSSGISSVTIEINGSDMYIQNADLTSPVDDLEYAPACN